ncbi:alpha-D-ribose 1-methylphosphonate 5-phosphate C-P lyase [Bradyrhizobium sp. GM7.3]
MNAPAYNFAYLDEQTKRMIRRAILKAIANPRLSGAVRQP